jgi:hypothetical protein
MYPKLIQYDTNKIIKKHLVLPQALIEWPRSQCFVSVRAAAYLVAPSS